MHFRSRLLLRCALLGLPLAVTTCVFGPTEPIGPATILLTPGAVVVGRDTEVQFSALAADAGGTFIPGVTFAWRSSDTAVATIDASGLAISKRLGTTNITAMTDSITSNTVTLHVITPAILAGETGAPGTVYTDSGVPFETGVSIDVNSDGRVDFDLRFFSQLFNNADVISWIIPIGWQPSSRQCGVQAGGGFHHRGARGARHRRPCLGGRRAIWWFDR